MGIDRHIKAIRDIKQGETIANIGRAYRFEHPSSLNEIMHEQSRIVSLARRLNVGDLAEWEATYQELMGSFENFIEECEKRGACGLLDTILEDGEMEVEDR